MLTRFASIPLLLAVGLAPRFAAADDAADRKAAEQRLAARNVLYQFSHAVDSAKAKGLFASFGSDVGECRTAIKDGTAAGWKPLDTIDTDTGPVMWKNAGAICDDYARLQPMKAAIDVVTPKYRTILVIRGADGQGVANMRGDAYREHVGTAKECVAAVDQALKSKTPADVKFAVPNGQFDALVTLAEVRKQCSDFVGWGAKAGAADDAAQAAATAALREKYAKEGITGDRLKYLMESDTHLYVMGKGCKALDMAGKKKAAVIYEMQEGDTYWVVYKMAFKGDKLVKTTEKRFNKATSRGWACK
jgi:hypothetical protein